MQRDHPRPAFLSEGIVFLLAWAFVAMGLSLWACSDNGPTEAESTRFPVKCIPEIEGDAFRTGTAVTLLEPHPHSLNDHCVFQDRWGGFHLLAIDGGAPWQFHNALAHGVGETLAAPMTRRADVLEAAKPECTIWAPTTVRQGDTLYLYYTDAHYCEPGPLDRYAMNLAVASWWDPFHWERRGVLFWENGFARDPQVLWEPVRGQWIMYFNRKLEAQTLCGMTAVSYKVSQDLVNWSEETWNAMADIPDTQILPGAAESPHVVCYRGYWYLFFTHPIFFRDYNATFVFRSSTPYDFGSFDEPVTTLHAHAPEVFLVDGRWYITHAGDIIGGILYGDPDYRPPGVQIAGLRWVEAE